MTLVQTTNDRVDRVDKKPAKADVVGKAKTGDVANYVRQRVAILGAGYISPWHAMALKNIAGVELVAVCDRALAKARDLCAQFNIPKAYGSLEQMLSEEQPNAVHVLLPPELHFSEAQTILAAGVNVLLEKPMCTKAEECAQLMELAEAKNLRLGVGHNFLFANIYEQLREDMRTGLLGRIDTVNVTWHMELPQARVGPFDAWMLREPENILLEIGPHVITPVLDLFGNVETFSSRATNPITLPNGGTFYRRWKINADKDSTAVEFNLSFVPGYAERFIHLRGSLGSATVDFERNTYLLRRHTSHDDDFDRFAMTQADAKMLRRQAWGNIKKYVLSKAKLSKDGSAYGSSIQRAVEAFYDQAGTGDLDNRIRAAMGRKAVALLIEMGRRAALPRPSLPRAFHRSPQSPGVLILGASGFIGQELTRQLVTRGRPVRVLVRSPSKLPADFLHELIDVVPGDASNPDDLDRALQGIKGVFHLARAMVKTWPDYQSHEIEVTRLIASRCLAAKVERFIYTGTIDSYYSGRSAGRITEKTPLDPKIARRNLYARAKAMSEDFLLEMHRRDGLPLVIIRPGIVIGQGGSPCHGGVGMWRHGSICKMWGQGRNVLPFVLVEDVADGLIRAMDVPDIEGESFNLVADPCLTACDYLNALERSTGVRLEGEEEPIIKFYFFDMFKWGVKQLVRFPERRLPSYRDWESRTHKAIYDCSKAKTVLGWQPETDTLKLIHFGIELPALWEMR